MGNNAVKGVIIIMLLVILSVVIGVQVSGSFRESMGAFFVIAAVSISFAILLLGKQLWKMLFILPYFIAVVPFHLPPLPWRMVISVPILACWCIMWALRQVKMRWLSLPLLDFSFFLLLLYMVVSFYRYPVAITALGIDYEYVGGKEYFYAVLALVYYVTVSVLPIKYEELMKVFKWAFYCLLVTSLYRSFASLFHIGAPSAEVAEGGVNVSDAVLNTRFSFFSNIGMTALCYLYARYPLFRLLTSTRNLFLSLLSAAAIVISGWRGILASAAMEISFIAIAKRELSMLVMCMLPLYVLCIGLGSQGALNSAPFGVQRALMALPGMHVSEEIERETKGSSDIRVRMWKRAMDPRTGFIKDYVWGDGFQTSFSMLQRDSVAMRRCVGADIQTRLESVGAWHNGWITYIHRLGFVGFGLIQIFMALGMYYTFMVIRASACTETGGYVTVMTLMYIPTALGSGFMVFTVPAIFMGAAFIATTKLVYVLMKEQGLIQPLFRREQYVPMSIREIESAQANAQR